jgi:methyl-accepting chemotaxis protein
MFLLKRLKIRTRLLIIIFGCSLALVCLGLTDRYYLGAMTSPSATVYQEAVRINLWLLVFFIVCGAGLGAVIGLSINSSLRQITQRMRDLAEGEGDLTQRINIEGSD